ncbi:MAG: CinA family protein [Pelistega sp.]|nr:CinA family protein [Pelistega sp.]
MRETTQELALAQELGELVLRRGWLLATAESCTGGLLAGAVTGVSGSSQWFDRGFVTYTNEAKIDMLGVHNNTLERFGAVSEEVAKEMSEGTLAHAIHSCCAISTTGIAGPTGGTEIKPVGMVCFGFSWRTHEGVQTSTCTEYFTGSRAEVRASAVEFALTKAGQLFGQD